ncbi:MAG TPA: hypothetical protein VLA24_17930 [Pseudomonadales bacterium]|nr:hypothetical protein [Pseudomonadales bacterium]
MMLEQWQFSQPIGITVSDGEAEKEYRLTFKTMTAFDEAKFRARRGKIQGILVALYGNLDERTVEQTEDADALADILFRHAIIMSALATVEVLNGKKWEPTRLPEPWYDAKEFAFNAPAAILDPLVQAVLDAGNPYRLFTFGSLTDDEKKMTRLTVRPSSN